MGNDLPTLMKVVNFNSQKYFIPEKFEGREQEILGQIDKKLNDLVSDQKLNKLVFDQELKSACTRCHIVQDRFNNWKYIVNERVFTIKFPENAHESVKSILDKYQCTPVEDLVGVEDDTAVAGTRVATTTGEDAVGESKVVAGEELEEGN